ncbi:hypothetical protein Y1Q_0014770 [Alligator mississippiensis]|uniref:Uncharacterized protein n=1 Tax=Alligator mississippiensis TaxID=8496 RepID=A0A151M208_ALLMI|nr:hypothetical protein Y1Q_0014770 [Alligator mississippiensis]
MQFGRATCVNDTAASLLIQKLEPIDLPPVITSEARWRPQEQEAAQKAKEWEKRVQAMTHATGRRQHLHKLQMLEMNRKRQEAEMKRGHHREAKLKQKPEELKHEKVHGRIWRNNSSDSEDRGPVEAAQAYTKDHRTTWDGEFLEQRQMFESHLRQSSKVEMWSLKQQAAEELFWDSSSTDSEDWKSGERKLYHRPALLDTLKPRARTAFPVQFPVSAVSGFSPIPGPSWLQQRLSMYIGSNGGECWQEIQDQTGRWKSTTVDSV